MPPPKLSSKAPVIRARSTTPAPPLKVLKTPTHPPSSHPALRSITTPRLPTSTPDPRKLTTPSTTHIALATHPLTSDGAAHLLSLSLLQQGGVEYVPPSQRPIVAGLGNSPKKHGEKVGLTKGGMAEMAKAVLARARQATTLWAAENVANEKGRRRKGAAPNLNLVVKVTKAVHTARGGSGGGFGSLEPPPRAILVDAVVNKVSSSLARQLSATDLDTTKPLVSGEQIQVLFSLGPNDTASEKLSQEGILVAISLPWAELSPGPPSNSVVLDTRHPPPRRIPAQIPLPSPLGDAGHADSPPQEINTIPSRSRRSIFCDRYVVIMPES